MSYPFRFHVISFQEDGEDEVIHWASVRALWPDHAAYLMELQGREPFLVCSEGGDVYLPDSQASEPIPGYCFVPIPVRVPALRAGSTPAHREIGGTE